MTHHKRHRLPIGERALTPVIAGHLPYARPFTPLPNGCTADATTLTSIIEIEPILRWQSGLAQILEYWTLTLQSAHPVLILINNDTVAARRAYRRATTTIQPLPVQLWLYDPITNRFLEGGPTQHRPEPPTGTPTNADGSPWHAPPYLLDAYKTSKQPYRFWLERYQTRHQIKNTTDPTG